MKKRRRLLLLIILLLILLIILIIIVKKDKKENIENNADSQTQSVVEPTPSELDRLKEMNEKGRITFYFNKYIKNIEDGNIKEAYNMLYDDFKNTYFKTIDEYEKYINEKYPDIITVNYSKFQREGIYYIMTLEFQDVLNDTTFNQIFVLREYDYNDFKLSFQAE